MIPASKLPYTVKIQQKYIDYAGEGMPVETWRDAADIAADVQPLGGEMAYKHYGITETGITLRMFCNPSSEVQTARRVVYDGASYEIRHVAAYRSHLEVLLRPEVV